MSPGFLIPPVALYFGFNQSPLPAQRELGGLFLLILVGLTLLLTGILGLQFYFRRRKLEHFLTVLREGELLDVPVQTVSVNHSLRVNKRPQKLIDILLEDEVVRIKTFDGNLVRFFIPGQSTKLLYHRDFPGALIPLGALHERRKQSPTRTINA